MGLQMSRNQYQCIGLLVHSKRGWETADVLQDGGNGRVGIRRIAKLSNGFSPAEFDIIEISAISQGEFPLCLVKVTGAAKAKDNRAMLGIIRGVAEILHISQFILVDADGTRTGKRRKSPYEGPWENADPDALLAEFF